MEVTPAELPAAIRDAIRGQVNPGKLIAVDKTFDYGETTYDATMTTPDGRRRDFSLSADGKLLTREVAVSETPAAVQQTIWHTLGTTTKSSPSTSRSANPAAPSRMKSRAAGTASHSTLLRSARRRPPQHGKAEPTHLQKNHPITKSNKPNQTDIHMKKLLLLILMSLIAATSLPTAALAKPKAPKAPKRKAPAGTFHHHRHHHHHHHHWHHRHHWHSHK